MSSPFNSDKFRKLKSKWYVKLKNTGFPEIEDVNSVNEMLIVWNNKYFASRNTAEQFAEKQQYYILASQLLESYKFKNALDKSIWAEHADGRSLPTIIKKLGTTRYRVNKVLKEMVPKIKNVK